MKLFLKVFAAILCLCAVAFFVLRGTDGSVQNTPSNSVNLSLFEAADSADFMIVYAVGLGEVKRKRTVDGRLYRNFVQLLRTNRMQEDLKDTFSTSCKTGVRIDFYRILPWWKNSSLQIKLAVTIFLVCGPLEIWERSISS